MQPPEADLDVTPTLYVVAAHNGNAKASVTVFSSVSAHTHRPTVADLPGGICRGPATQITDNGRGGLTLE